MDEKDYQILIYTHQEKSLTKAADLLYTSQPSISYRIKQLEGELNIKILVRSGKIIEFTPEGEYLVSFARNMITNLQNLEDHLLTMSTEVHGNLRIAVTTITARYYLPELLKIFTTNNPFVKIHLITEVSNHVLELLESERVHVGIIRGDYNWPEGKLLLSSEEMYVISKTPIDLIDLPEIPQIYYRRSDLNDSQKHRHGEDRLSISWKIQNWWNEKFSSPPLFSMEVGSYEACKELVRIGLGYAIIPGLFIKPEDNLYIQKLIFDNGEVIKRNTWLLYRDSVKNLFFVKKFIETFDNHLFIDTE